MPVLVIVIVMKDSTVSWCAFKSQCVFYTQNYDTQHYNTKNYDNQHYATQHNYTKLSRKTLGIGIASVSIITLSITSNKETYYNNINVTFTLS